MAKKQKELTREGKQFKEKLSVRLTDTEKRSAGEELATVQTKILDLEEERTAKAKAYNADIKDLKKTSRKLVEQIHKSEEMRDVDCQEVLDFAARIVRVKRLDTNEEIRSRMMTEEELQMNFPLGVIEGKIHQPKRKPDEKQPDAATS